MEARQSVSGRKECLHAMGSTVKVGTPQVAMSKCSASGHTMLLLRVDSTFRFVL